MLHALDVVKGQAHAKAAASAGSSWRSAIPAMRNRSAPFHKRTGRIIKLLTVQKILDEEHVQKM